MGKVDWLGKVLPDWPFASLVAWLELALAISEARGCRSKHWVLPWPQNNRACLQLNLRLRNRSSSWSKKISAVGAEFPTSGSLSASRARTTRSRWRASRSTRGLNHLSRLGESWHLAWRSSWAAKSTDWHGSGYRTWSWWTCRYRSATTGLSVSTLAASISCWWRPPAAHIMQEVQSGDFFNTA